MPSRERRIKDSIMTSSQNGMEQLEDRVLLSSVVLQGRELIVHGDPVFGNNISVSFDAQLHNVILNLNGVQYGYGIHSVSLIDLIGGAGNDWLHADELIGPFTIRSRFYGLAGNNTIVGGSERDLILCGGAGNDTIYTGNGDDTVVGGAGNDSIIAGNNFKLIYAAKGNNSIILGHGQGYIFGGQGANYIQSAGSKGTTEMMKAATDAIYQLDAP